MKIFKFFLTGHMFAVSHGFSGGISLSFDLEVPLDNSPPKIEL